MRKGGKTGGKQKGYKASHTLEAQTQRQYVIKRFEEAIEPITNKAIDQAKKGDRYARDWLSNRSWGLPHQTSDINVREIKPFDDVENHSLQEDKESQPED